jgi:Ca2+-binding EF-hand superfamily protein
MSSTLSTEQVLLLCDCFQRIDSNNDGSIDVSELDSFLKQSFPEADDETLVQVRKIIIIEGDSNSDGKIDIKEFVDLISQRQYEAVLAALEATPEPEKDSAPKAAPEEDDSANTRIQSILAHLEPREIDILRDAFIKLDTDGDGYLSLVELRRGLELRLKDRFASNWPYLEKIFEVADWDHDSRLSIFEFLSSFADGPGVVPHEVVSECVENVKVRLTDEELETLRDRFYEIDKNQDNFIDKDELLVAMKEVLSVKYPTMTDAEFEDIVTAVLATADADKDGKLNLSEFIRSYQEDQGVLPATFMSRAKDVKRRLSQEEVQKLKEAFAELDENADGFVDYGELYKAVTLALSSSGLNEADTADLVDTIMLTADRNRDGKLSMTEFIRNFVMNETIMAVPVEAAMQRRVAAKAKIEDLVDSGDLYRMVKLFAFLDSNQDGFLDRDELFGLLFRTLSEWYPAWDDAQRYKTIELIIDGADVDGDGKISIDEFVHSYVQGYGILPVEVVREIASQLRRKLTTEELQQVHDSFVTMDANGDGFVTNEELRGALAQALGPVMANLKDVEEITEYIMSRVDTNRDGRISLKEFIASCELDEALLPQLETPGQQNQPQQQPEQQDPREQPAEANDTTAKSEPPAPAASAGLETMNCIVPLGVIAAEASSPTRTRQTVDIEKLSPISNDVSKAAITDPQLRIEFERFDTADAGKLTKQDFKKKFLALEWCGLVPTDAEFEKLWKNYCGRDNELTYAEFCLFMLHRSRM